MPKINPGTSDEDQNRSSGLSNANTQNIAGGLPITIEQSPNIVPANITALLQSLSKGKITSAQEASVLWSQVMTCLNESKLNDALTLATEKLSTALVTLGRYQEADKLLRLLFAKQEHELGKNCHGLARTEMLIGICHQYSREPDVSVKFLRSAVVRFQQSDQTDRDLFIECLCALSWSYRDLESFGPARTCIKQAYKILQRVKTPLRVQNMVLEELSACLLGERRYKAAKKAYQQLIELKKQMLDAGAPNVDMVRPLLSLGQCNFALQDLEGAEMCLFKAGEYFQAMGYTDRRLHVQLMEATAGILRHRRQFLQADYLDEVAMEIQGRLDQAGGHVLYGNLVQEAQAAEKRQDLENAKAKYRDALRALEWQRKKRAADRIQILARIVLCTSEDQIVQRISLFAEIEDGLQEFFTDAVTDAVEALRKVALILRVAGKHQGADDLLQLAKQVHADPALMSETDLLVGELWSDSDEERALLKAENDGRGRLLLDLSDEADDDAF
jgi:tetratricopeptide (TPR) repeat protein